MNRTLLALLALLAVLNVNVYADTLAISSLTSFQGFTINGPANSQIGYRVSSAGDFNNDGFDDLFVVSKNLPEAYLILGGSSATNASSFTVSASMSTSQGFKLVGPTGSTFGSEFASGDFNEDGFSDLMIGASGSNAVYVIFGCATTDIYSRFGASFTVSSSMTTAQGFQINGPASSQFGIALASGDFNNDGRADVVIGANNIAQVYIIFGCSSGLLPTRYGASFTVSASMDWTQGIQFKGSSGSNFGLDVAVGDLDGDRLADIIIGGFTAYVYVIKGTSIYTLSSASPFGTSFTVSSTMTSAQGFELKPAGSSFFGSSVSAIGDFNNDGFGDFVIGTPGTVNKAYVLFGGANLASKYGASFSMSSSLSSSVGFEITGSNGLGNIVSKVGDINGDDFADVIIGADDVAYVLFGCSSSTLGTRFGASFAASSSVTTAQGLQVTGVSGSNFFAKISSVGDINNDGYDDLFFGAITANKAFVITGYCQAGTYFLGSSCVACPANSYCSGGRTKSSCPAGAQSPASSTSSTACSCTAGSYSTTAGGACITCPANSYCTGGTAISSCPSGTASNSSSSASSACKTTTQTSLTNSSPCSAGTYSTTAEGSCLQCPANSYCTGGTTKQSCPQNTASPAGSKSSSSCVINSPSGADTIGFTPRSGLMTLFMLLVTLALF